jgi:hypothetical protein
MPTYEERPDLALAFFEDIEAGHEQDYQNRNYSSPHASASAVIYCLRKAWCRYHPGQCQGTDVKETVADKMGRALGLALHALMSKAEKSTRSVNVPLGTYLDGVYVAAEADSITTGEVHAIEDGKTTRKEGCTYDPNRDPAYVEQLATYLVLHNLVFTEPLLRGVLHVWHVIGCYGSKAKGTTRNPFPIPTSWIINFDWDWLTKWQREVTRRAKIVTGPDLPEPNPYDWECKYCPLAAAKGGFCEGPDAMQVKTAGFFPLDKIDVRFEQDREGSLPSTDPRALGELSQGIAPGERDV